MSEIDEFEKFHPRAVKLMRKRKNFIVIAEDEPYFIVAYDLIRIHETANGTWSDEDERAFRKAAQHSVKPTLPCGYCQDVDNAIKVDPACPVHGWQSG